MYSDYGHVHVHVLHISCISLVHVFPYIGMGRVHRQSQALSKSHLHVLLVFLLEENTSMVQKQILKISRSRLTVVTYGCINLQFNCPRSIQLLV